MIGRLALLAVFLLAGCQYGPSHDSADAVSASPPQDDKAALYQ